MLSVLDNPSLIATLRPKSPLEYYDFFKVISDLLEDGLVSLDTVKPFIPDGYVYDAKLGEFLFIG